MAREKARMRKKGVSPAYYCFMSHALCLQWAADKSARGCNACGMQFGVLIRRHHCQYCGQLFCGHCIKDCWCLPKFEYLQPVRVCGACSKLCWKAAALVQAIAKNDVSAVSKFVSNQNDCMLHTGVYPPIVLAASAGFSEICHILLSGGAKVNYAASAPRKITLITCSHCNLADAVRAGATTYKCKRCREGTRIISDMDTHTAAASKERVRHVPPSDFIGMTALIAAVREKGHADVVRELITSGADLNACTQVGCVRVCVRSCECVCVRGYRYASD